MHRPKGTEDIFHRRAFCEALAQTEHRTIGVANCIRVAWPLAGVIEPMAATRVECPALARASFLPTVDGIRILRNGDASGTPARRTHAHAAGQICFVLEGEYLGKDRRTCPWCARVSYSFTPGECHSNNFRNRLRSACTGGFRSTRNAGFASTQDDQSPTDGLLVRRRGSSRRRNSSRELAAG